jgi:hypothetical protein
MLTDGRTDERFGLIGQAGRVSRFLPTPNPRESNKVAHLLACHAQNIETTSIWRNSGPDFILHQLGQDEINARGS